MAITPRAVLGLDIGGKRIGVAAATLAAGLPRPVTTLRNDDTVFTALNDLIKAEAAEALVVGLPRGLSGQTTAQTETVEAFIKELERQYGLPVYPQDEAVTSKQAEAELKSRGKPYKREDVDALAATYILDDWLGGQRKKAVA